MSSHHISLFFLKRLRSPAGERRCAYSPTPERGRTTAQRRQERRDRDQGEISENKENNAVQDKDVEIFALPPPRTPASSKKNSRTNKNVLTTPNQNANFDGSRTKAVTPKGKNNLCQTTNRSNSTSSCGLFVYCNCFLSQSKISIRLFALANCPTPYCSLSFICPSSSDSCSSHNHKCHIHMPHICK